MRIFIVLLAAVAVAGCKQNVELPSVISPYKIDIQQGNVVTQEMVGKLKAGMTRSQVRFVLGSPLVADMFHDERWDYIYLMQRQGKPDDRRRLTVIFEGEKLLRLEGDVVLTDKTDEPPAVPIAPAPKPKADALKADAAKAEAAKAAAAKAEAAKAEAAKAEAAKAAAAKAEAAKAEAAKAEAAKAAAAKADAAKAEAARAEAAKAEAAKAAAAKADAAKAEAAKTDAAKADAAKSDAAKTDTAAADDKKDPPKRGVFGRMLDKIGF